MWCECGATKARDEEMCPQCAALDGYQLTQSAQELIAELRIAGSATWETILTDMCYYSEKTIRRAMKELIAAGRVRRRDVEMTIHDAPNRWGPVAAQTRVAAVFELIS